MADERPRIGCMDAFDVPVIASAPAVDSPLAYNEDEIVSVITDIYKLFLNLNYLEPSAIIFPPEDTGRQDIDTKLLSEEYNMNPTVVSLVQRLPYVVDSYRDEIVWYPESIAINVLEEDGRVFSRDPSLSGDP